MPEDKISKRELEKTFKNYDKRATFIFNYPHFGADGNDAYYIDFIDTNITNRKYKLQEDAIELSLATNNFNLKYLDTVSKIIYSRRTIWIKLLCLDWLNYFILNVPREIYADLNRFANKSDDEMLKLQSILNLVQLTPNRELLEESLEILKRTSVPTLFYRYLNCINDNHVLTMLPGDITQKIHELINSKPIFGKGQKDELKLKLSAYLAAV